MYPIFIDPNIVIGTKVLNKKTGQIGIVTNNVYRDTLELRCQVLTVRYSNCEESYWAADYLDFKVPLYIEDFENILK